MGSDAGWRATEACCALALLIACDPVSPPNDGGSDEDGETGVAVVELRLGVEEEEEGTTEWELSSAYVRLAEVRADNDRGSDLEPVWVDPGWVRLDEEPEARLSAVPATYGGVSLQSADGAEPTFELAYRIPDGRVVVRGRGTFSITARCEAGGVTLPPASEITLHPRLDVGALAAQLDAVELPDPVDGQIEVTEATAPDVLADLEASLSEAWHIDCEGD